MAHRTPAAVSIAGLEPHTSPPLKAMSRVLQLDPTSGVRRVGTSAHGPAALGRNLEQNNINSNGAAEDDNLMLVVELNNCYLSLLSIENNWLQLGLPNRPNFSRLNSNDDYGFEAGCDKWVVLGSEDKGTQSSAEFLWDPKTDELRPIPQFYMKPHLAVEDYWYTFYGVGFDSDSGDYKVVRCSNLEHFGNKPDEARGELLSIGTGLWREIQLPHNYEDLGVHYHHCIDINGFYYWSATLSLEEVCRDVIVPFDFRREEFSADFIPMPDISADFNHMPDIGMDREKWFLAEYHGSLAVIFQDDEKFGEDSLWLEIWVWSNGDRSWSYLSTFRIPAYCYVKQVVGLYNNDKVILLDSRGALLVYDCATAKLKSFGHVGYMVYPFYSKSNRNRSS